MKITLLSLFNSRTIYLFVFLRPDCSNSEKNTETAEKSLMIILKEGVCIAFCRSLHIIKNSCFQHITKNIVYTLVARL